LEFLITSIFASWLVVIGVIQIVYASELINFAYNEKCLLFNIVNSTPFDDVDSGASTN
jgi:hypothetical protein